MTHTAAEFKALLQEIEFLRGVLTQIESHCEEASAKANRTGLGMVAAHFDGIAVLVRESLSEPDENGRRINGN